MNKADLVNEVAKVVATKKAAQDAVDTVFASITKALKKKEVVTLVGFGTFKVGKRKAGQVETHRQAQRLRSRQRKCPGLLQAKV